VQDAGELQLGQFIQLQAQGAAAEIELARVGDQLLKGCALQRDCEAAANFGQIKLQRVGVGDHNEAGQSAFAGFGLEGGGQNANYLSSNRFPGCSTSIEIMKYKSFNRMRDKCEKWK